MHRVIVRGGRCWPSSSPRRSQPRLRCRQYRPNDRYAVTPLVSNIPGVAPSSTRTSTTPWGLTSQHDEPVVGRRQRHEQVDALHRRGRDQLDGRRQASTAGRPAPSSPASPASSRSARRPRPRRSARRTSCSRARTARSAPGAAARPRRSSPPTARRSARATRASRSPEPARRRASTRPTSQNRRVDVFDGSWTLATPPGAFVDPKLPDGYSPFGIQTIQRIGGTASSSRTRSWTPQAGRGARPGARHRRRVRHERRVPAPRRLARRAQRAVGPDPGARVVRPVRRRPARSATSATASSRPSGSCPTASFDHQGVLRDKHGSRSRSTASGRSSSATRARTARPTRSSTRPARTTRRTASSASITPIVARPRANAATGAARPPGRAGASSKPFGSPPPYRDWGHETTGGEDTCTDSHSGWPRSRFSRQACSPRPHRCRRRTCRTTSSRRSSPTRSGRRPSSTRTSSTRGGSRRAPRARGGRPTRARASPRSTPAQARSTRSSSTVDRGADRRRLRRHRRPVPGRDGHEPDAGERELHLRGPGRQDPRLARRAAALSRPTARRSTRATRASRSPAPARRPGSTRRTSAAARSTCSTAAGTSSPRAGRVRRQEAARRLLPVRDPDDRLADLRHVRAEGAERPRRPGRGPGRRRRLRPRRRLPAPRRVAGQPRRAVGPRARARDVRPRRRRPADRQLRQRLHPRVQGDAGRQLQARRAAPRHAEQRRSTIDGLWALQFARGGNNGTAGTLYFTAGPALETHGLFGKIVRCGPRTGDAGGRRGRATCGRAAAAAPRPLTALGSSAERIARWLDGGRWPRCGAARLERTYVR